MALYSKQVFYCNACGVKCHAPLPNVIERTWRVCTLDCYQEMNWREVLSTMGEPYKPRSDQKEMP